MNLRSVKYFVDAAKFRSFSRAARVAGVAQPALSRHIHMLEHELGVPLFHRHGRGVVLTTYGERFLEQAAQFMTGMEALRRDAADQMTAPSAVGQVTIGMPIPISPMLAAPLLEHSARAHPGLSVRIVEGFSGFIHDWLLTGSIDIALLYGPSRNRMIKATPLLVEDLYAIGPEIGKKKNKRCAGIKATDLMELPLVLPHKPHAIRDLLDQVGLHPNRVTEADALGVIVQFAISGKGFTILPVTSAMREIAAGQVRAIPVVQPNISWVVSVCHVADRPISAASDTVIALVEEQAARLVREGVWPGRLVSG